MAILFYDDISLDGQEIQDVSLERVANLAALNALSGQYQGRLAYNDDTNTLNYFNGTAWVALDGTGNIDSIVAGSGITINSPTGAVTIGVDYAGADNVILAAQQATSADTNSKILVSVGEDVQSHALSSIKTLLNAGISNITENNTASDYINTSVVITSGAASISALLKTNGTTADETTYYNGLGQWKTPNENVDTTYTLPTGVATGGGEFTLQPSDASQVSKVFIVGTTGEVEVTPSADVTDGGFTIGLPTNVTAPNNLTVGGEATFTNNATLSANAAISGIMTVSGASNFATIPTIPAITPSNDTDAASKAYVDDQVSGGLSYRGSYDATTDPTTLGGGAAGTGTGMLKGEVYVVSVAGNFGGAWSPALAKGDLIIVNTDTPENVGEFDAINKAEELATTTTAGLCMFPAGNGFNAPDSNGAVSMKDHTSAGGGTLVAGIYGSATQTPVITTDEFGSVTSCTAQTIQIATGQVTGFDTAVDGRINANSHVETFTTASGTTYGPFTHNVGTEFVTVQVYETAGGKTVYPQITRDTTTVTVTFKEAPTAATQFKVLVMGNDAA
tara:strand:- start:9368 stop:11056 length:1689 start_codon:yes stop_codon:yes gene_type:complete